MKNLLFILLLIPVILNAQVLKSNAGLHIGTTTKDSTVTITGGLHITGGMKMNGRLMGQTISHAVFSDTTTQIVGSTTRFYPMKFGVQEDTLGIYKTADSIIHFRVSGDYAFSVSSIVDNAGGAAGNMELWFCQNTSNVVRSNTIVQVGASGYVVTAVTFILEITAGDTVKLRYRGSDTNMRWLFTTVGTNPSRPSCPSTVLAIWKVSE